MTYRPTIRTQLRKNIFRAFNSRAACRESRRPPARACARRLRRVHRRAQRQTARSRARRPRRGWARPRPRRSAHRSPADGAHVCRPRSIFFAAHVAEENDRTFFAPAGAKATRFWDKLERPPGTPGGLFLLSVAFSSPSACRESRRPPARACARFLRRGRRRARRQTARSRARRPRRGWARPRPRRSARRSR